MHDVRIIASFRSRGRRNSFSLFLDIVLFLLRRPLPPSVRQSQIPIQLLSRRRHHRGAVCEVSREHRGKGGDRKDSDAPQGQRGSREKKRREKNGKGDQRSDGERIVLLVRGLFLPIVDVVLLFPLLQVIAAEGEQKASRALREASEVIADTPAALQLRYLQVNQSPRKAQLNQSGAFL